MGAGARRGILVPEGITLGQGLTVPVVVPAATPDWINVVNKGADPTGVSDSTAAFTAAQAALPSGGVIYVPRGTFKTSGITITGAAIQIIGDGAASVISGTNSTGYTLDFNAGATRTLNAIRSIQVTNTVLQASGGAIRLNQQSDWWISDVTVAGALNVFDGITVSNGNEGYVRDTEVLSTAHDGFVFSQQGNPYLSNTLATTCGNNGYTIDGVNGLFWTGAQAFNSGGAGCAIQKTGALGNLYLWFENCIMDTSTTYGWNMTQGQFLFLSNCWGSTGSATSNASQSGYIFNGVVTDVRLTNCIAYNNKKAGFETFGATPARLGFTNCIAVANNVANSANIGGFHFSTGANVQVYGCLAYNSGSGHQNYGILSNSTLDNFVFQNNSVVGNVTAGMLLTQVAGASQWVKDNLGWNPRGSITPPAVPGSGSPIFNTSGYDVMVSLIGGTLSGAVQIGGTGVGFTATNVQYRLPVGQSITLTYTVAPTWTWFAE